MEGYYNEKENDGRKKKHHICPFDNAPMESFNSILKKEEVYLNSYSDFDDAKILLFDFIEGFYNRNRIHSSINFKSPVDFENLFVDF